MKKISGPEINKIKVVIAWDVLFVKTKKGKLKKNCTMNNILVFVRHNFVFLTSKK